MKATNSRQRQVSKKRITKGRLLKRTIGRKRKLPKNSRRDRINSRKTADQANRQLSKFRQASIVAVAFTMLLLLFFPGGEASQAQDSTEAETIVAEEKSMSENTSVAADEALATVRELWNGFYQNLPKLLIALLALLLAWVFLRLLRPLIRRLTHRWNFSNAVIAVFSISVWLLAAGVALSVLAGDIRALVGSVGLVGLALSWALQTPIESFTGWLLNSFQGYYSVGDRIAVGEVFGDVYQIDSLTTTVWEIGSPDQPGAVQAEQSTGRLVTFPNNEILTGTVINLTRDFPYVWDELAIPIANESDISLAMEVLQKVADGLLGAYMLQPAQDYAQILKKSNIHEAVAKKPQLFISATDSWTNITIRYLVGAKARRKWKSDLQMAVNKELSLTKYKKKIISAYVRQQYQPLDEDGVPITKAV
ncbi:small-conductance mechanosensitive channel [Catalinimonas alkaloidigena]|uniref:mechanosensitive ion channel family protein n=1 Tax=Catalinimonas alkaloidigena TaxID=1075417 RepID=UPI002406E120|nr:mechanosensitive ion channel domain-containing protein [Catalinimonas alkaloidigena]MDF9800683.1 small-conductance mechanosensitive channel [Catalinimonas alkaloidigena]